MNAGLEYQDQDYKRGDNSRIVDGLTFYVGSIVSAVRMDPLWLCLATSVAILQV